jgi:hypothetical protein
MRDRMKGSVRLATVFIVLIMGGSLVLTMTGDRAGRYEETVARSFEASEVQSLQLIDLDGDGGDDLFVQRTSGYTVYAADGREIWSRSYAPPLSTTMGDVNGDGIEDVVAFWAEPASTVEAYSRGEPLWTVRAQRVAQPARSAVIRFASGSQVVVGDTEGQLVAYSGADGREVWRAQLSGNSEVRGLDDVLLDGQRLLVAADRGGQVTLFGPDGRHRWDAEINGLRRMRAFDLNGDGTSEVYFGGEQGTVFRRLADGTALEPLLIGQQVVELREGELDGDPRSRELVVGGRNGGVFAFTAGDQPEELWSTSLGDRIADLVVTDLDDDGVDEVVAGDESGGLAVFGAGGERYRLPARSGGVTALEAGRFTASDEVAVAAGYSVEVLGLERSDAPIFYTPLAAGLVLSLVIGGVALFVGGLPQRLPTTLVVTDKTPAGLLARRRMLAESLADVEELQARGEIDGPAALARLERLREQLADTDMNLRVAGVDMAPTTMKCPNCGGKLKIGWDKCEYCGEIVIA